MHSLKAQMDSLIGVTIQDWATPKGFDLTDPKTWKSVILLPAGNEWNKFQVANSSILERYELYREKTEHSEAKKNVAFEPYHKAQQHYDKKSDILRQCRFNNSIPGLTKSITNARSVIKKNRQKQRKALNRRKFTRVANLKLRLEKLTTNLKFYRKRLNKFTRELSSNTHE